MKKITLTLMLLALVGSSSDLCAKGGKNKAKKSSTMSDMFGKAKQMGGSAAAGMSGAASGAAAKLKSMRK